MRRLPFAVPVAALCLVGLISVSCGSGETSASPRETSGPATLKLPSQLLGLTVNAENIRSRINQSEQPYIDSVGLFAFRRENDLLEATLQASRFSPEARPESASFRGSIISRIGAVSPRVVRVSRQNVYLTSGRNQVVFIWFRARGFFVLTVRRDFAFPRTLLRRLIELRLEL